MKKTPGLNNDMFLRKLSLLLNKPAAFAPKINIDFSLFIFLDFACLDPIVKFVPVSLCNIVMMEDN